MTIEVAWLFGIAVRGVGVSMKKRKGVGVGVLLDVMVGVAVRVGVLVTVGVGPVAVGKGPIQRPGRESEGSPCAIRPGQDLQAQHGRTLECDHIKHACQENA